MVGLDEAVVDVARARERLRDEEVIWITTAAYLAKYEEPIRRLGYSVDAFAGAYSVGLRITPSRWRSL